MKKGPGDTLRWFRRGIFRAFYFFGVGRCGWWQNSLGHSWSNPIFWGENDDGIKDCWKNLHTALYRIIFDDMLVLNVVRCGSKCLDARNSYIIPALFCPCCRESYYE